MAAGLVEGDWHDADAVRALGAVARVVTLENEFVDAGALARCRRRAPRCARRRPCSRGVQDKALQKEPCAAPAADRALGGARPREPTPPPPAASWAGR